MNLEIEQVGEVTVLGILSARTDPVIGLELKGEAKAAMEEGCRLFVVDLSETHFVDSTSLATLVSIRKMLGEDGELVLCGVGEAVAKLLQVTQLDGVFRVEPERVDAIGALLS